MTEEDYTLVRDTVSFFVRQYGHKVVMEEIGNAVGDGFKVEFWHSPSGVTSLIVSEKVTPPSHQ